MMLAAAVVVERGRVLLVTNVKGEAARVEPPGGKVRDGEAPEACAVREMDEELGVRFEPEFRLGRYATESPEGRFEVAMFAGRITDGTPRIREPDKLATYGWYSAADLALLATSGILVDNLLAALPELRDLLAPAGDEP